MKTTIFIKLCHVIVINISVTISEVDVLFFCVKVLRPRQPIVVMSSTVSLPNHTYTGQA